MWLQDKARRKCGWGGGGEEWERAWATSGPLGELVFKDEVRVGAGLGVSLGGHCLESPPHLTHYGCVCIRIIYWYTFQCDDTFSQERILKGIQVRMVYGL